VPFAREGPEYAYRVVSVEQGANQHAVTYQIPFAAAAEAVYSTPLSVRTFDSEAPYTVPEAVGADTLATEV
jgi:hypothetical protein